MKSIVLLFTKQTRGYSEEFLYHNVIEGVPKGRFCDEAEKDNHMTIEKFYKDKFALVIDLINPEEVNKNAHGKKIVNTQNGVLLEIKKTSWTSRYCKYRPPEYPILDSVL